MAIDYGTGIVCCDTGASPEEQTAAKSELSHNEGGAAVGAQSFSSIALTCEMPEKPGPCVLQERMAVRSSIFLVLSRVD